MKVAQFLDFEWRAFALAVAGSALLCGSPSVADEVDGQAKFAAPQRIKAGEAFVGAGRLYPSPVFYDVNGDGHKDIVVGDLFGRVTFAAGTERGLTPETPLLDSSGKALKFQNW